MDKWQLIDFLGDENDIDDVDYRAQFDFSLNEEETTMPTGVVMDNFANHHIFYMENNMYHRDGSVPTIHKKNIKYSFLLLFTSFSQKRCIFAVR